MINRYTFGNIIELQDSGASGHIDLSENPNLSAGSIIAITQSSYSSLAFRENQLTDAPLTLFNESKFHALDLGNNALTDLGAKTLADGNFSSLALNHNKITTKGAISLSTSTTLTTLDLSHNAIDCNGITAHFQKNCTLTSLNLSDNQGALNRAEMMLFLTRNRQNEKEFLFACGDGQIEIIKAMLSHFQVSPFACERTYSENMYCESSQGDTLNTGLHLAAQNNQDKVIEYLAKACPKLLTMQNAQGKIPAEMANNTNIKHLLSSKDSTFIESPQEPVFKKARTTFSRESSPSMECDNDLPSSQVITIS